MKRNDSIVISLIILSIWLAGVILTTTAHEFWRDEVRALSLARAAVSPMDLFRLTRYDGHPVLWYFLLYIGKSILDTPLVLPITSIVIAFAAVSYFMFFSPFPLWIKTLFIFSVLPFYEYSVMARNYGISMLLLFVCAGLYHKRAKSGVLLAFMLLLLANTNVHAAILVCIITAVWIWDTITENKTSSLKASWRSLLVPLIIVASGVILSLLTTWPTENTILTDIHSIELGDIAKSFIKALALPARTFHGILPLLNGIIANLLLFTAIFGLVSRINLFLAALFGQVAFGVFFDLIYKGSFRHQGLFFVFLIFLYWIALEATQRERAKRLRDLLFRVGLYGSLVILMFLGLYKAKNLIIHDIRYELSSSQALGTFINESAIYRDAILIPEPDLYLESLPYYADNDIYLPREKSFGKTVSWTTDAEINFSLDELLSCAHEVRKKYGRPVLIVLGHLDLEKNESHKKRFAYNKIFSWSDEELSEFYRNTEFVGEFNAASGDENYIVYAVNS